MQIMPKTSGSFFQSGQVAVSILLLMSVLVVISFSLAERTTNEIALTTQTTESAAVFNAAETGVNEALATIFQKLEAGQVIDEETIDEVRDLDGDGIDDVDLTYSSTSSDEISTRLMEGMTLVIKLQPSSPDVDIQWGREADCADRASLMITIYSDDAGTTRSRYYPVGCDHGNNDHFEAPSGGSGDYTDRYLVTGLTDDDLFIRIKAIYNDTNIYVTGSGGSLGAQSFIAQSTATNLLGDAQETRALEVIRSNVTAPSIMDYAVYTEGSLAK